MKRACAIAFVNAFSQLGNISGAFARQCSDLEVRKLTFVPLRSRSGAYTYPAGWGPSYQKSFGIGLGKPLFP